MTQQTIRGHLIKDVILIDDCGLAHSEYAVAVADDQIVWVGLTADLPNEFTEHQYQLTRGEGRVLTPGLIDCHTHLVYAGQRANEFKLRHAGATYAEISAAGGGINATVTATRAVDEAILFNQSLPRLLELQSQGVTTVEIKSGYGLSLEHELKMLRVARRLGAETGVRVRTTFLGAHALPPEYIGQKQAYVDYLCSAMMPAIAQSGLADAVDVFCESIGFSLAQTEQIFRTAKAHQLPVKCHAEQLSNIGASELAAQYSALSCDHLEYADAQGIAAMAHSGTVAVLLPGAWYFLNDTHKPPISALRAAGVPMAIATDCNPGSSPTTALLLMMNMACQLFGLTIEEVLAAVTINAAKALGVAEEVGSITSGKIADLVLWSVQDPAELCYYIGSPVSHQTMRSGRWLT